MNIIETTFGQQRLLSVPRSARLLGYDKKPVVRMTRGNRIPHLCLVGRTRFNSQTVANRLHDSEVK